MQVGADAVKVTGKNGTLEFPAFREVAVSVEESDGKSAVVVAQTGEGASSRASEIHGLVRASIANMVHGVSEGFTKELEIVGTGWNAKQEGNGINMQIGFCHPVVLAAPDGIDVKTPSPNTIVVTGADKQAVGQFAAIIRAVRPPEPYKGKGIRYKGEVVRRKAGKTVAG